jgi:hypothetical protein
MNFHHDAHLLLGAGYGGGLPKFITLARHGAMLCSRRLCAAAKGENDVSQQRIQRRARSAIVGSSILVLGLAAAVGPSAAAAQSTCQAAPKDVLAGNLLVNGDAETGPAAPTASTAVAPVGWCTTSSFTSVKWGGAGGLPQMADTGPQTRGVNLFAGGPNNASSSARQTVDLSAGATMIDQGQLTATLSGYLGGFASQSDSAVFSVTLKGANGAALGTMQVGPVTPAQRNSSTGLLPVTQSVMVPAGARSAEAVVTMTRKDGSYNDGYADNLSLILANAPPPQVEPAAPLAPVTSTDDSIGSGSSTPDDGLGAPPEVPSEMDATPDSGDSDEDDGM